MYLKTHQPDLGITDPYELTQRAARRRRRTLLKQQATMIDEVLGALHRRDRRVRRRLDGGRHGVAGQPELRRGWTRRSTPSMPSEGVTGWADTWMISTNAPHPNCMLEWMKYTLTADVQARGRVLVRGGDAATPQACPHA